MQASLQEAQRAAGVDDLFDDQNVFALNVDRDVAEDAAALAFGRSHVNEIQNLRQFNFACEIRSTFFPPSSVSSFIRLNDY